MNGLCVCSQLMSVLVYGAGFKMTAKCRCTVLVSRYMLLESGNSSIMHSCDYRFVALEMYMCMLQCACYNVHATTCMLQCACYNVHATTCMLQCACYNVHATMCMCAECKETLHMLSESDNRSILYCMATLCMCSELLILQCVLNVKCYCSQGRVE